MIRRKSDVAGARMKSAPSRRRLAVFTKAPTPGQVKTRLAATLGAHGAATQAIRLETLIYDEENEAESVAPFFAQLPVEQRDAALATLAAQGGGGDDD